MKKIIIGIIIIALVGGAGYLLTRVEDPVEVENVEETAREWIEENAPTYTERGGRDLTHLETVELEEGFEVTFEFDASEAGYGTPEEDEAAAQVITPHIIVVEVVDGEIVSAITDEVFDEINEEMIEEKPKEEEEEDLISANLYFYIVEEGQEELVSVEREFPIPQDTQTYVLNELLEGPTEEEREDGVGTAIDEQTELLDFYIENNTAHADFSNHLDAAGSATVVMIRDQIENTLLQFENIEEVIIYIEGESEGILQP